MKLRKIFAVAMLALSLAAVLCACSDNSVAGRMKAIEDSVKQVNVYTAELTITDGSTKVYGYKAVSTRNEQGYAVEITEGRYNSSFEYEENVSERSVTEIAAPLKFTEEDFTVFAVNNGTVNALVGKAKLASVINVSPEAPLGDARITINFDKDKVTNITVTYHAETSGQDVSYVYTFGY